MDFIIIFISLFVAWIVFKWIKLVWFRSKTLSVLKVDMNYEPSVPGHQSLIFNEITREAKLKNYNHFDAAIAFMFTQIRMLSEPYSDESKEFIQEKLTQIQMIIPLSTVGEELYIEQIMQIKT